MRNPSFGCNACDIQTFQTMFPQTFCGDIQDQCFRFNRGTSTSYSQCASHPLLHVIKKRAVQQSQQFIVDSLLIPATIYINVDKGLSEVLFYANKPNPHATSRRF
jgi:hypothetical protein